MIKNLMIQVGHVVICGALVCLNKTASLGASESCLVHVPIEGYRHIIITIALWSWHGICGGYEE